MKISEMSRDQKRDFLESSYDAAVAAHEAEPLPGGHPSRTVAAWSKLGQGRDDMPGNVGLAKPIEDPLADEEIEGDPSSPVSPAAANRAGGKTAIDGRYQMGSDGVPRFETPGGYVITGDAALEARARQGTSASGMNRIPGYGRLK